MRRLLSLTNTLIKLTQALNSFYLIFSVVGIVGFVSMMVCKVLYFKHLLYIAWMLFGLLAVFSWTMSIFTYTSTVVLYEMCDSIN